MSGKSLYQQCGSIILLCVSWYAFSAANNVISKQIFNDFPYPLTLCMVQLAVLTCFLGPSLAVVSVEPCPRLGKRLYLTTILPLALGKLLATFSAYLSVLRVPVSYAHTIKAMMPFFTVMLSIVVMKERHPVKVYLSLLPIVVGVLIATVTEVNFDLTGMVAALVATLTFALQNIYSKKCMKDVQIHHLRLLLLLSQISCFVLLPIWLYTDAWTISLKAHEIQNVGWLLFALPLNGVLNFAQNIVAFSMISAVSPVSYSVANATKRIVVIGASLLFLQNPITAFNLCGMLTAISGVALYNKTKYDSVKAKKSLPILPTDSSQLDGVTFDLSATPLQFTSPLKMIV